MVIKILLILIFSQYIYADGKSDCDVGYWHLKKYNFEKSRYFFNKSCMSGYGIGCFELGEIYNYAKGIKQDECKAYLYYKKACRVDNSNGCFYIGRFYENGIVVEQNYSLALENYAFACDNKNGAGCSALGLLYKNGKGVEQNLEKAKYYLDKGCSLKSGVGCIESARLNVITNHTDKSYKNAIDIYSKSCNKFYNIACLYLGEIYDREDTKFYDNNMSKYFFKKACDFGNSDGCLALKSSKEFKDNFFIHKIDKSKKISDEYACELGRSRECYKLGKVYFEANGVRQNTLIAKDYLRRGCYLDNSKSCAMLGFLYEYDDKGLTDYKMATRYYKRACMLGGYDCKDLLEVPL